MNNRYSDLIDQTFFFPQEGFDLLKGYLTFNGIPIMNLIEEYGTPLKITYLPKIGDQIKKARNLFNKAIRSNQYNGRYYYSYCTKCCHFSYALNEVLDYDVQLETSSAFDIDLIEKLYEAGKLSNGKVIISNVSKIAGLTKLGFYNVIPVVDNAPEFDMFTEEFEDEFKFGVRLATNEEPHFDFYTSRLGFGESALFDFVNNVVKKQKKGVLKMLHFFVDTGIKDSMYYWGEFKRCIKVYCELKKICPSLRWDHRGKRRRRDW